ncbi:MAG: cellulase [Bacteroidales bacterium]|nr:cellulase [Bacteroidales bacterium]
MKRVILIIFAVFSFGNIQAQKLADKTDTETQISRFMTDSLDVIAGRVERQIIPTRYMEQELIGKTDTLKGWEGIEVSLYHYKVHGTDIIARVYLADADSRKIASWIISTCVIVTGKLSKSDSDKLIKDIRFASGGQFPVLGMVYEDMYGTGQKCYLFKDGVTVYLADGNIRELSEINDSTIVRVGKYARIISTTREEYINAFGAADLEGKKWLEVVKNEYKKALLSNRNNLMIAKMSGTITTKQSR